MVAETSVEVSEGFKCRREDASGMNKVYVERFCVVFLNELIIFNSCPNCSLNVLVFGKARNPGALL